MRRAPTPAITSRMYRHFATLTVILTATVAFFANGENEQAAAAQAAANRPVKQHTVKPAEPAMAQPASPAADADTWGSDDSDSFGAPTLDAPTSASGWWPGSADVEDGDDDVVTKKKQETAGLEVPTAAQIAAAEAASRQRSGSAESGD